MSKVPAQLFYTKEEVLGFISRTLQTAKNPFASFEVHNIQWHLNSINGKVTYSYYGTFICHSYKRQLI